MRRAILAALGGMILGASAASAQLPQASAATLDRIRAIDGILSARICPE